MSQETRPLVAVLGAGPQADAWASAVGVYARVVEHTDESRPDAVVIAPGAPDPFAQAREALLDSVHVLYAAPFRLTPWQAGRLNEYSGSQRAILRFAEPFRYQRGFPFMQRLLEGREPFWRPLYLRSLWLGEKHSTERIDDLATQEFALVDSLTSGRPLSVSATAVQNHEATQVRAASITVEYTGGLHLYSMVSLAEAGSEHQLVAVASERTVTLDQLDPVHPLRIGGMVDDAHEMSLSGQKDDKNLDVVDAEIANFVDAVSAGDTTVSNGGRWTRVAGVWWAARQSMSFGGTVDVPSLPRSAESPPLRVIEGGGDSSQPVGPRPVLTVVAR